MMIQHFNNDTWAFGDWWQLLNKELAERGQPEALFGEARYHHSADAWPSNAARDIIAEREERAA
jgi:hypothetical protein